MTGRAADMEGALPTSAVAADAPAVTEIVAALESALYGHTAFSQADLEDEWSDLDLEQDTRVVRNGDRIVGYGVAREQWRAARGPRGTSTPTRPGEASGG